MACMWLKNARGGGGKKLPADVPRGHLAVIVGEAKRRFVIRADYLNHPLLQQLLDQHEGYGFNKSGPLAIPCDEYIFADIIQALRDDLGMSKDSQPLIQGYHGKRRSTNSNCIH